MEQLERLQASDLLYMTPELTVVIAAVLISIIDLILPRTVSRTILGWLTLAAIVLSGWFVLTHMNPEMPVRLLADSYRIDDYANLFKLIFLAGTGLVVLMSIGSVRESDVPHVGEYYYLLLPALLGAMVMASSADLITLFVGLELLSITSYILVGMRKKNHASNEGAFKYLVLGSIASAIILYGMSFLYGVTGTTNLSEINQALAVNFAAFEQLIYIAFFLLLAGFGFKIAAAPFHAWAPDVYQGAPTPIAAFLAIVSKAASFAILIRILYITFGFTQTPISQTVFLSLAVLAAIAMIVGNAMALRQQNAKRLLALSGVANTGYLLVPFAAPMSQFHAGNLHEFLFYLLAYLLMNAGMLAVLLIVQESSGTEEVSGFAGLYYRAPWTAAATVVLVLSLAGLPITAGFIGKLFILLGTLQGGNYWLAAILIGTSVMSYYFYFGIIRQMFMRSGGEDKPLPSRPTAQITIWICALLTLAIGIYPNAVFGYLQRIFTLVDFFA